MKFSTGRILDADICIVISCEDIDQVETFSTYTNKTNFRRNFGEGQSVPLFVFLFKVLLLFSQIT